MGLESTAPHRHALFCLVNASNYTFNECCREQKLNSATCLKSAFPNSHDCYENSVLVAIVTQHKANLIFTLRQCGARTVPFCLLVSSAWKGSTPQMTSL